jgi:hypothetical protein
MTAQPTIDRLSEEDRTRLESIRKGMSILNGKPRPRGLEGILLCAGLLSEVQWLVEAVDELSASE